MTKKDEGAPPSEPKPETTTAPADPLAAIRGKKFDLSRTEQKLLDARLGEVASIRQRATEVESNAIKEVVSEALIRVGGLDESSVPGLVEAAAKGGVLKLHLNAQNALVAFEVAEAPPADAPSKPALKALKGGKKKHAHAHA